MTDEQRALFDVAMVSFQRFVDEGAITREHCSAFVVIVTDPCDGGPVLTSYQPTLAVVHALRTLQIGHGLADMLLETRLAHPDRTPMLMAGEFGQVITTIKWSPVN